MFTMQQLNNEWGFRFILLKIKFEVIKYLNIFLKILLRTCNFMYFSFNIL